MLPNPCRPGSGPHLGNLKYTGPIAIRYSLGQQIKHARTRTTGVDALLLCMLFHYLFAVECGH